jgi:hypothetical protein
MIILKSLTISTENLNFNTVHQKCNWQTQCASSVLLITDVRLLFLVTENQ